MKLLTSLFLFLILLFACTSTAALDTNKEAYRNKILNEDMFSHEVKAYVACWPLWTADSIDGSRLNEISISFLTLQFIEDQNGEYLLNDWRGSRNGYYTPQVSDRLIDKSLYKEIAKLKERYPHLRISIAFGGAYVDGFSDAVLTEESRKQCIDSLIDYIKKHGFDGVDLDWEFPVSGGWGTVKARPEDWTNFAIFIEQLRSRVDSLGQEAGKYYSITIAAHPSSQFFESWVDLPRLIDKLDSIHIMTYDNFYQGRGTAYHNNDTQFTEDAIKLYLGNGYPPEKILIGAAFYGKHVNKIEDIENPINAPYPADADFGWLTYKQLNEQYMNKTGFIKSWDEELKAPFLWNPDKGMFITYEDPRSIGEKTRLIKEYGLGGIFMWEYSQDYNGELLKSMSDPFLKG